MADRAASEVLGFALVFSLVVASVAVVSVSGLGSLQSARDAEQMNNAERAFDVLSDNMADMYERGAPSRATEVSLGGAQLYTADNVTINVTAVDTDSGDRSETVRTVRPIVYRGNGDRRLVYEGGAVFRTNRDGGIVVEQPPFLLSSDRAYLPVVATQATSAESAGGSTVLLRANKRSSTLTANDSNARYDELYVNVTSPRADLWATYLDGTTMSEHKTNEDLGNDVEFVTYKKDTATEHVYVVAHDLGVTIER